MYVEELREFRTFLRGNTDIPELRNLNLLGVQFSLCEDTYYYGIVGIV